MRNVIVTGIPRSGTTLTAALIDSLPDSVCLNEPDWQVGRRFANAGDYAKWLVGDFMALRQKLVRGEPVKERRDKDKQALTNYFSREGGKMHTHYDLIDFTREGLTPDFLLAVKHNGPYLAILKPIIDLSWFSIVAIVRNPIEVIHSWRRLDLPISRAEMPGATPYWPRLAEIVSSADELLIKQVKMYDLMCRRIYNLREHMHVLPYEKLIQAPELLSQYIGSAEKPKLQLIHKPKHEVEGEERDIITRAVKAHGEFYKAFYPGI